MIKKHFFAFCAIFFVTSMLAQTGLSCENPIVVGKSYEGKVDGACSLWYTASTYDLPLHVYFIPDSAGSELSPELFVDFTCDPGVYEDEKLDSLINKASVFGLELPMEFSCDLVTFQGRNAWEISISSQYRDQLSEAGITYNVQAFVEVRFHESGVITMTPDTVFTSCLETSETVNLGDTLNILPNDSDRVFLLPYTDWQRDSIQFVWIGESNTRVWLGTRTCDFIPVSASAYVWNYYDLSQGSIHKLQRDDIKAAIKDAQNGGIFYGKILSQNAGKLVVEKIPVALPANGAVLLEYDKPVSVKANSDQLYAFPKTWVNPTMFLPSSTRDFQMQICNSYKFIDSIGIYVNTYSATYNGDYAVYLTSQEMTKNTNNAKDKYVYVRFITGKDITVTPYLWNISPCVDKSQPIYANEVLKMTTSASSNYYRLRYDEFSGYDLTVNWEGKTNMTFYVGDTCRFTNSASNARVVHSKKMTKNTSYVIPAATVDSWASRVDADGYLYVRFSSVNGNITFQTEKTFDLTPVYTTINDTLCFGETYDWVDTTYTETGAYEKTFTAANGADSIVTLNLTILPEVPVTVEEVTVNYNETYTWQGKEYTETTNDTVTLENQYGCDSVVVLQLTVLPKPLSACVENSSLINSGDQLTLSLNSTFTIYRIDYNAWIEKGATLTWTGAEPLHMFIAETCTFAVAPYNKYVHVYAPVPAQGEHTINASAMADLAEFVDEDGFLYIRFLTEKEGVLTVE